MRFLKQLVAAYRFVAEEWWLLSKSCTVFCMLGSRDKCKSPRGYIRQFLNKFHNGPGPPLFDANILLLEMTLK